MYSFNEFCEKKNYMLFLEETSSLLEDVMGKDPSKKEKLIHLQEILKNLAGMAGNVVGGFQKAGAAVKRAYGKGRHTPHERAINNIDTIGGALATLGYQNSKEGQDTLRFLQDIRLGLEKQSGVIPTTYQGVEA